MIDCACKPITKDFVSKLWIECADKQISAGFDTIDLQTCGYVSYEGAKDIFIEIHKKYPHTVIHLKACYSRLKCGFVPH